MKYKNYEKKNRKKREIQGYLVYHLLGENPAMQEREDNIQEQYHDEHKNHHHLDYILK